MDLITSAESLKYIDRQLKWFQESKRMFLEKATGLPAVLGFTDSNSVGDLSVTTSVYQNISTSVVSHILEAPDSNQKPYRQQSSASRFLDEGDWSNSASECSAARRLTTLSGAGFKTHERTQFAKLFLNQDARNLRLLKSGNHSPLSEFRKSLRRNFRFSESHGALNIWSITRMNKDIENLSEETKNAYSCKSGIHTGKVSSEKNEDHCSKDEVAYCGLPETLPGSRYVPRGHELTEVQLSLQENILSQIAHQTIKDASRDSESGKANSRSDLPDNEESPEDLDRELEVTLELMNQLRMSLNDGSYQDMRVLDIEGVEESKDGTHAIVYDILLMLRHAFRDILATYDRAYRPTGFAMADHEMVTEMDTQLLARENLLRRYPKMTIKEILESLGGIGREADLKTLADI